MDCEVVLQIDKLKNTNYNLQKKESAMNCCCCFPCVHSNPNLPVREQLETRQSVQASLQREWKKLSSIVKGKEDLDLNITDLRELADQLRQINENLAARKSLVNKTYTCINFWTRVSKVSIVGSVTLAATLLAVASLNNCYDSNTWKIVCMTAAFASIGTTLCTFVFQSCFKKLQKEKTRLETFSEREAQEEQFLERIIYALKDYNILTTCRHGESLENVRDLLSGHTLDALNGCVENEQAKDILKAKCVEWQDKVPHRYKRPGLAKRAMKAIEVANRIARGSLRKRDLDSINADQRAIDNFANQNDMESIREQLLGNDQSTKIIITENNDHDYTYENVV